MVVIMLLGSIDPRVALGAGARLLDREYGKLCGFSIVQG